MNNKEKAESRLGEININHQGLKMIIIKYNNSNDIEVIDEELHSQVPTRKGLCYQVNELQQAVQSIKRVIYISTGVMFAIQGLPVIRQILIILTK